MAGSWSPKSWQSFPIVQQPTYENQTQLANILSELERLPPLVTSWEVDRLRTDLAAAQLGDAWLLQGGDCAEMFEGCQSEPIASKLKVLLQMSLAIVVGARCRIIRLGRMAGQYAKPRSSDTETQNGVTLPCYRGDLINKNEFTAEARRPDPMLLLRGYERSALTMNFIRGLSEGGFADLHHPENWNLTFVDQASKDVAQRYQKLVESLGDAIRFMETILGSEPKELRRVDFYTSHEALHLAYETALTRKSVRGTGYYNLSTHLPWIGDRTRSLDGAHVEYFRGIRNPIAVKVGPSMELDELSELVVRLNPENEPGRLTLIHRMGHAKIAKSLPPMIEHLIRKNQRVLWICDPMHGNTVSTQHGRKTRRFHDICEELRLAFEIHRECNSKLGGAHLELTGENVTECVGGSRNLTEADLESAYHTQLDPRLNYEQALEIAFEIAEHLTNGRRVL
ncbi:MAG: 3-deoxy-7-phosphoheptulonate synthase class II [Pirellulaceae bacterium]|nr:3-deoxy-7-phosphoheptulonate synthase class II [Pirellulaceae bacterium]